MKLFVFGAIAAMSISPTFGADKPPTEKPPVTISLTPEEVQIVAAALNMSAGTCVQDRNGCIVGLSKSVILKKLEDASNAKGAAK